MSENPCSCCQLFGKAPARVNFIITTGVPSRLLYRRIRHIIRHYSDSEISIEDKDLTNYGSLEEVADHLFHPENKSTSTESKPAEPTNKCCFGYCPKDVEIEDDSGNIALELVEKEILDILTPSTQGETSKEPDEVLTESPTWVHFFGPQCLQPSFLNIFLQIKDRNVPLNDFTLKILCFCVNERRFFENWIFTEETINDYKEKYPLHEKRLKAFFDLLHSSNHLQKLTYLYVESEELIDDHLRQILKRIFRQPTSENLATNSKLRWEMATLLKPRRRNAPDIRQVRNSLQGCYQTRVAEQLKPLLRDLQRSDTAMQAARKVAYLVLNQFERTNEEELRAYRRQFICGSNSIGSELTRYALRLLQTVDHSSIPFLYAIVLTICVLSSHFHFRHEFFSTTPEIFKLSIALITQRQYHLTIAGLRLCSVILRADQNEHKYSIAYLTHDPSVGRKLMNAVLWLLSPFIDLTKLWEQEETINETPETNENEEKESAVKETEHFCFRHADLLLERAYFRTQAELFYGSADHCREITPNDIRQMIKVMNNLVDKRLTRWFRGETRIRSTVHLLAELCAFLMPIYLYGPAKVCSAITDERTLLVSLPRAIHILISNRTNQVSNIEGCVRFYARFVELQIKESNESSDDESDNDDDDENQVSTTPQPVTTETTEPTVVQPLPFDQDLIAAHYKLCQEFLISMNDNEESKQQEQLKKLFDDEWKKIDVLQQKLDHDRLKQEHQTLNDEFKRLADRLERTKSECEQFQQETIHMGQEIDRLRLVASSTREVSAEAQVSSPVVTNKIREGQDDIIDQLKDLAPDQITPKQAERCIRELHRRRTTFDDLDMRKSICGSLKHLGSDLYSSSVHFLHELIQNAEDNSYDLAIDPSLRIELHHDYILLSNNEEGLRVSNVVALCSLAVSTKTSGQQYIGEKGVGFKSVFAASNQPTLISKSWRFSFCVPGSDAMAYITPVWIEDGKIPESISQQIIANPQHTYLYLPLKLSTHTPAAEQFIDDVAKAVDPCILLNMRQLKKLETVDRRHDKTDVIEKQIVEPTKLASIKDLTFETCRFFDLSGSIIRLKTSSGYDQFRVYTCQIDIPNYIEKRENSRTSLTITFPIDPNYSLNANVYTGLPVCDLGFNFMFNASFQLVTSRENVRENSQLNTFLRDHLAVLFVYLLLNDVDLRKDMDRYCPSHNLHQIRHSSWWLKMLDRIYDLMNKYISDFFGIHAGKLMRYINEDLLPLVSNEQLYECANIQVIDSHKSFLTAERLKSLRIDFVSLKDLLECFPNRDDNSNFKRQEFFEWTKRQDERWWSLLFHHLHKEMTTEMAQLILQKPIFLLQENRQRCYLPSCNDRPLKLFICDRPSMKIWKRQLTILRCHSTIERDALLRSSQVQLLDDEKLIEIIRNDHLQLSLSSMMMKVVSKDLIEEIWQDLLFLESHRDKVKKESPIVVPIYGIDSFTLITNAVLPTILGISVRSFLDSNPSPMIDYPYFIIDGNLFTDNLRWESFFLEMNCQRPDIYVAEDFPTDQLPILPPLTMLSDDKYSQMADFILSSHTETTLESLRQFSIVANVNDTEEFVPVSLTFDESMVGDLPSLPRIQIPSFSRKLAIRLGVRVDYDLRTCVSILQLLTEKNISDVDLYIQWLGRLQLYIRDQYDLLDPVDFRAKCRLYLPDQEKSYPLEDLLVIDDQNTQRQGIAIVSKYLQLQIISPAKNQCYWQFKELFRRLGCQMTVSISNICATINDASQKTTNFFSFGDCQTTLSETGLEMMITLFQYLEHSIKKSVIDHGRETDLYRLVIDKKNPKAPCGSREDLQWRFDLISNEIPTELKKVAQIDMGLETIPLLTIDRQLVRSRPGYVIYACLETKIIQNLARDVGKRWFILPEITRTCPLLLATFNIDYVERRGKIEWFHRNNNLEYKLCQLSEIFQEILDDKEIQVTISRFASASIELTDVVMVDMEKGDTWHDVYTYVIETDFPCWVFGKTIHLCYGDAKNPSAKAVLAASALATVLHKRKHLPFDEAKTIARQKVQECTAFSSDRLSDLASTSNDVYSFLDVLFPTDHHVFETMGISVGRYLEIERDLDDDPTMNVAIDKMGEYQAFAERVRTQNHCERRQRSSNDSNNPIIVDNLEHIRIGQTAEHFFFMYLQKLYGTHDVTPTKNWRSSNRLAYYRGCNRYIDDSIGYDFELHDTQQQFVQTDGPRTKTCYFEVKGTSGFFDEANTLFHVSENEFNLCSDINRDPKRREGEAYFIVIVERCLDTPEISLGPVVNWSANLQVVQKEVESYRCRLYQVPKKPPTHNNVVQNQQTTHQSPTDPNQQKKNPWQKVESKSQKEIPPKVPLTQPNQQQQQRSEQSMYDQQRQPQPSTYQQQRRREQPRQMQQSSAPEQYQMGTSYNRFDYSMPAPGPAQMYNPASYYKYQYQLSQYIPQLNPQQPNVGRGRGRGKNKKSGQQQ